MPSPRTKLQRRQRFAGCFAVLVGIAATYAGFLYLLLVWDYVFWTYQHDGEIGGEKLFWRVYVTGSLFWMGGLTFIRFGIRELVRGFRKTPVEP